MSFLQNKKIMIEEIAIFAYLPIIFYLKWYIDSLPLSTRKWLSENLEYLWVVWCTGLSIFSTFGTYYTGRWLLDNMILGNYYKVHGSDTEFWYYAFIGSKVWEFIDTLLIIGRSKPLVSLQYGHHFLTAIMVYFIRPISCDIFTWLFFLNYFVHMFMYGYFALYPFYKSAMKKFGTFVNFIQATQMFLALVITIYYNYTFDGSDCIWVPTDEYTNLLVGFILSMYAWYAYEFISLWFSRAERIKNKSN